MEFRPCGPKFSPTIRRPTPTVARTHLGPVAPIAKEVFLEFLGHGRSPGVPNYPPSPRTFPG